MVLARAGLSEEARSLLQRFTGSGFELQRDWQWLACTAMLSDACAELCERDCAAILYDRLSPYGDRCIVIGAVGFFLGSVHGVLGRLAEVIGNPAAAHDHFEKAHAIHTKLGARLMLAHSLCNHTLLLERAPELGQETRENELRRKAEALALELGSGYVGRRLAGVNVQAT